MCPCLLSLSDSCVDLSVFVFFVRELYGFVCIPILLQIVLWIFSYLFSLIIRFVDLTLFVLSFAEFSLLRHKNTAAAPYEVLQRSCECYFVCNGGMFGTEKEECLCKRQ